MDRERFEHLLEAYGADLKRWPAPEHAAGAAYAAQNAGAAELLTQARALDRALDLAREAPGVAPGLSARILAHAPQPQRWGLDRRAAFALAACAVFGVVLGYGGGLLAPPPAGDDAYFTMAFEAPFASEDEG